MDSYLAVSIAEGFADEPSTENEVHDAWQYIVDHGLTYQLQGWFGRTARDLVEAGIIQPKE